MKKFINIFLSIFNLKIVSASNINLLRNDPFEIKGKLLRDIDDLVIFDVGAYIGDISHIYRTKFPNSTIYSFEPFEDSYLKLEKRFENDFLLFTERLALNHESGVVKFNINDNLRTNSILSLADDAEKIWPNCGLKPNKSEFVKSVTLDAFLQMKNINGIHLLKIDAQGSELQILKGGINSLSQSKVKIIYLEVLLKPTYDQQASFDEIINFLKRMKYSLFDVYNREYFTDGSLKQIDVIFIENEFLKKL